MAKLQAVNKNRCKKRQFNQEQYEILLQCCEKRDMTEWNEWRKNNIGKPVYLEGTRFLVYDRQAGKVMGSLANADLSYAHLEGASLVLTDLRGASLSHAYLGRACLQKARLEGTDMQGAHLEGTDLKLAVVDGGTLFWKCKVDKDTDFRGVGLDSARIDSKTREQLKYNIRRMNWEQWYRAHRCCQWLVRAFWAMSDYGRSTGRIIFSFAMLAIVFAGFYYLLGLANPPGVVDNLFIGRDGVEVQWWLVPLRALYFSIVTMTTFGFGDMYANSRSPWGHLLLSVQVIWGYVLLGVLVARLTGLFGGSGPVGKLQNNNNTDRVKHEGQ